MEPKFTFERGDARSVWAEGRGYQQPSPRPEGGGEAPPIDLPPDLENIRIPGAPLELPMGVTPEPSLDLNEAVRNEIARLAIPMEMVNLDKATARFRGHSLDLCEETVVAIQSLLVREVVLKLEGEQRRVIESVQYERLSVDGGPGRKDVLQVQGETPAVAGEEPQEPKKVLGVRKQKANRRAKNVPGLSGQKGGKA